MKKKINCGGELASIVYDLCWLVEENHICLLIIIYLLFFAFRINVFDYSFIYHLKRKKNTHTQTLRTILVILLLRINSTQRPMYFSSMLNGEGRSSRVQCPFATKYGNPTTGLRSQRSCVHTLVHVLNENLSFRPLNIYSMNLLWFELCTLCDDWAQIASIFCSSFFSQCYRAIACDV